MYALPGHVQSFVPFWLRREHDESGIVGQVSGAAKEALAASGHDVVWADPLRERIRRAPHFASFGRVAGFGLELG